MPDYRARQRELEAQCAEQRERLAIPLAHALEMRLVDLAIARKAALEEIERTLVEGSTDPIAKKLAEKCEEGLERVVVPLPAFLNTMRDEDAVEIEDWVEATATADSRFFKTLGALELGEIRDQMAAIDAGLQEMIRVLEKKWATLSEENQRLERLEQEASEAMTAAVQKALADGIDMINRYGEASRKVLDECMKIPDLVNEAIVYLAIEAGVPEDLAKKIPKISLIGKDTFAGAKELGIPAKDVAKALEFLARDPGMAASETVQRVFGREMEALITVLGYVHKYLLPMLSGEYQRQLDVYQRALPNQGSVLVSLSQTRRDVEVFLDVAGLEQLQTLYEKAIRALDDWVNAMPSDGLEADANEFRLAAKAMFDTRFEQTTHAFEEFVRANKGRFVGSIERETENALLWTDIWVDRTRGIANLGMDARLREWHATTIKITEDFDSATRQVRQKMLELPMGVADPLCRKLDDAISKIRYELRGAAEPATAALNEAANTYSADKITRDLDRSRLRERLYA
jgi:hypothetical protein